MEFALWICIGALAAWLIGRLDLDASVRDLCRNIGAGILGAALGGSLGALFTSAGPDGLRVSGILGAEIGGIALAAFVHRRFASAARRSRLVGRSRIVEAEDERTTSRSPR